MSTKLKGVPIVVDENRYRGGLFLIDKFKPDIIIHSAASKFVDMSEKFVSETINSNIVGSKNLIIKLN